MQHLLQEGPLLDSNSELIEGGYAFSLVKTYNRDDMKFSKMRIKEWDYYYVGNATHGVALTVADNSYMSLVSASLLDFEKKTQITKSFMSFFSNGKLGLPSTSKTGDVIYKCKDYIFKFVHEGQYRHIYCQYPQFVKGKDLLVDIRLEELNKDTMVIATPFDKPHHFYYNQKINNLGAEGFAKLGDDAYFFNKGAYGVLDWGRGIWTYSNTWYWSSLSTMYNNHLLGWNLGYGFGNTSQASENMVFFDGKAIKLDQVEFIIPKDEKGKDDFLKKWKIVSNDSLLEAEFEPILDRYANSNVLIIQSKQHQVFGKFSGKVKIGNTYFEFKDVVGFAEKVKNRW